MSFVKVKNITTPQGFWVTLSRKVGFLEGALGAQLNPSREQVRSPLRGTYSTESEGQKCGYWDRAVPQSAFENCRFVGLKPFIKPLYT